MNNTARLVVDTAAVGGRVAADGAVGHRQRGAVADAATRVALHGAVGDRQGGVVADADAVVADDATVTKFEPSSVNDGTAIALGNCETGDSDVRGEIFKHARTGNAVARRRTRSDRQISSTGANDAH